MRNAFADTLLEIGRQDSRLVVLVGDISHGILQPFARACPGRYFNVGILEPTIVSMSAGLARSGLHPVAHTIAPFIIERSVEQIKLDFCYQNIGGTIVSVGSAFDYAGLGCSHHCYTDLGIVKAIPGTQVIYPAMPNEFNLLFKETYRNGNLTYFRLPGEKHGVHILDDEIKLGTGIRVREGKDITVLALGPQLKVAVNAADTLAGKGISTDVLYYPTVKPFDSKTLIGSVEKTRRMIVIEEHSQFGGVNEDVLRVTCNLGGIKHAFINIPDAFCRGYGSYGEHCAELGFTSRNVTRIAESMITRTG
ncbi:MAG: transketolase C-terminal domain-containing protein [Syntrophobacteraceae bacterium]